MPPLYILSNEQKFCGASAILYKENLDQIANDVGADLYLWQASSNEWLVGSVVGVDPKLLYKLLRKIKAFDESNVTMNFYRYHREGRVLTIENFAQDFCDF